MSTDRDGVGRSALIAISTGALFAAFVMIAPRLVASGGDAEPSLAPMVAAAHMSRAADTAQAAADQPEVPDSSHDAPTTTVPDTTTTTTTTMPTTTTTTTPEAVADGTISLQVEITAARNGKQAEVLRDGDELTWHFVVTAEKSELWGVFLFLEHHGHVPCETRHLELGESTQCVTTTVADEGEWVAEAWVDGWTLDHQVTATIHPLLVVAPRL